MQLALSNVENLARAQFSGMRVRLAADSEAYRVTSTTSYPIDTSNILLSAAEITAAINAQIAAVRPSLLALKLNLETSLHSALV